MEPNARATNSRYATARVLAAPNWKPADLLADIRQLAAYGDLLLVLCRHRIDVRYKQSLLGSLWAILQPVAMMVVYTAVFSRLVKMPSEGVPYPAFAYTGILPWAFFSAAVANSTVSLVGHAHLVARVYFPREILPLSYVAAAAVDLLIGSSALVVLFVYFRIPIGLSAVAALPIIVVLAVFALGCGLILSAVQVRFRDVGVALPVGLQLLMFASPILYPLRAVPAAWRPLYILNPIAGLGENFRRALLGAALDYQALTAAVLVTAALLPVAYLFFKQVEATVADVV
jgi:lipopolysaccharide transport system permease protein